MIHPLYWISALVFAIVLGVILINELHQNKHRIPMDDEKAIQLSTSFHHLLMWVFFFCLQDVLWGIAGGPLIGSRQLFFFSSTVFHLSTVLTTFFWLKYMLAYLSIQPKIHRFYLLLDNVIILAQIGLLGINLFYPVVFTITPDGSYQPEFLRIFAFFNQYIVYISIGIGACIGFLLYKGEEKIKHRTVMIFALAPVLSGIFQYLYPDGPFYSLGYFLSCFMIHTFLVLNERNRMYELHLEKERIQNEQRMAKQVLLSNTDELTGCFNRRAYEDDLANYPKIPTEESYIFGLMDLNGLKVVNDTYGHEAGDELILGAVACMKQCIGSYGRIYRVGGDEFVAQFFADPHTFQEILRDFEETQNSWTGKLSETLAISSGFASKQEFPDLPVVELAKIAEKRMYEQKAAYYQRKGFDRRGQRSAHVALISLYTKILKVNLTEDTYQIINIDPSEQDAAKGYAATISEWLYKFGVSGQVHPDDLPEYLRCTDLTYLRNYFNENKALFTLLYRRKYNDDYKQVAMEMIPADDYRNDYQNVFLYVKSIDK